MAKRSKKLRKKDQKLLDKTVEDLTPPSGAELMARVIADDIKFMLGRPSPLRKLFPVKEVKIDD